MIGVAALLACSSDEGGENTGTAGLVPPVSGGVGSAAGTGGATNAGTAAGAPFTPVAGAAGASGGAAGVGGMAGAGAGGQGGGVDAGTDAGTGGQGGSIDAGTDAATGGADGGVDAAVGDLDPFSFFVTSYEAMQRLSGSPNGFGGDLRYGEADGITGADKICTEIAEYSMPGAGAKGWHAFLSAPNGPGGGQVNAIDRIGEGPWVDRLGRMVAANRAALLNTRPAGADAMIVNDLPNEYGVPNHAPDPQAGEIDNHHVLTGSDENGELYGPTATCESWTSTAQASGRPRVGFSWPAGGRQNWISGQDEGGCGAGVDLDGGGGSDPSNPIVGSGGGYGGIYCFALTP